MASVPEMRRWGWALTALCASALLIWLGTGLDPVWPLTWLAPLPVLLFALNASAWRAALVAGLAMCCGLLNLWSLLHGALGIPVSGLVRAYLTASVVFALATLLFRALAYRRAYWSALVALPACWVAFEWLSNLVTPHGTGGSLAYSQLRFLPFLQLASITGPWGMSFLLCALPAAVALAIQLRREAPRQGYRMLGATLAVMGAVLVFGVMRLSTGNSEGWVRVGLVASDGPNEDVAADGPPTAKLYQAYESSVLRLARDGAAVVVLPEKTGVVVDPETRQVDEQLQSLADRANVELVVGVVRVVPAGAGVPRRKYNEARVYTPRAPVQSYDKEHMLPPFESSLTPGTSLTVLHRDAGPSTWGVAICKDMDFTQLSRRYGTAGAGLMLVPAWDFYLDWIQHGHMAVMRGVESGFSVARSAKGGSLYVSDDRGRVVAELKSDSAPFSTLLAQVPQRHDRTLFLRLGDWFAWVSVAMLVLCLAQLLRARPQMDRSAPRSAPTRP
jgi:apolipoprotein N-acyltransferase